MTISSNIYGSDDRALAHSIASDALSAPTPSAHNGAAIANDAVAKGNLPDDMDYDGEAKESHKSSGPDGRARTSGNHGTQE